MANPKGTIFDKPFNNNPSCLGICTGDESGISRNLGSVNLQPFASVSQDVTSAVDQQKTKEVDDLLSQSIFSLTFEERQEQQEVLHGVDNQNPEDPALIEAGLQELDHQLMSSKRGTIYELAESMDPSYVHSKDFRLIFLRTDRYDAKDAAKRILRFFELKQKLFGTDKLVKDITLADMNEDDIASIKTGSLQPVGRDLSGRQVFIQFPALRRFKRLENELRAQYYITMSVLKSETTQIRGCVWLIYSIGDQLQDRSGGRGYAECASMQFIIPPNKASIHCAIDSVHDYLVQNMAIKVMPLKLRARMKLHYGSHVECQYRLSTFGILPSLLPFTSSTNDINLERHQQWFNSSLTAEQSGSSPIMEESSRLRGQSQSLIATPSSNDVLCTGNKASNNMGNQQLMILVKQYCKIYTDARTDQLKRQVVAEIVEKIHSFGGRFLKQIDEESRNGWEELTEMETKKKIMQSFRNFRRRQEASKKTKLLEGGPELLHCEPMPADVIFGRVQSNPGNDLLQRLIKEHGDEYDALDRGMKMRLVKTIIQAIKDKGGRFLQPATESGSWLELHHEATMEKVSKYFRNNRRPSKKPPTNADNEK